MVEEDGFCSMCRLRDMERDHPSELREWLANLVRLWRWKRVGYDLSQEGLTFEEWAVLVVIDDYFRELEAQSMAGGLRSAG
jgi:hypothetical protein